MEARLRASKGNIAACMAASTADERRAIAQELRKVSSPDPAAVRYFIENYFVINTKGEGEAQALQTMYPLKETQEVLWADFVFCWTHGIPTWWILLKARQIGWSTLVQAILFQRTIFNKLMKVLVMADERTRSQQIFNMSLLAHNYLPFWMRPEIQYNNRGEGILHFDRKDDDERATNPGLNSTFYVDAANKPSGSSRGFTLHGFHISEFGLFLRPGVVTSDIIPATAKKNPLVLAVIEGTANQGQNEVYQRLWDLSARGESLFRPQFAGWFKERAYSKPFRDATHRSEFILSQEETELVGKIKDECDVTVTLEQISWYREQADMFEVVEKDRDKMEQEYPSYPRSAFRASGICAFPRKKLSQIEVRDVRPPIWFGDLTFREEAAGPNGEKKEVAVLVQYPAHMRETAPLWVWEWPRPTEGYYGGSDPSQGIPGKDNSACSFWRVPLKQGERIRQCAEYEGLADPKLLAKIVCALGRIYNTAEIAPECNTLTEHIGNIIQVHEYPKIYRWRRQDKIKGHWTNFFGWETGFKSRADLIVRFKSLMIDDSLHIKSQRLLQECSVFVDDSTGRFEAQNGFHDDTLFAAMIAVYCLFELDPRLFLLMEKGAPDPNQNKQNTDFSLFEDELVDKSEFACL